MKSTLDVWTFESITVFVCFLYIYVYVHHSIIKCAVCYTPETLSFSQRKTVYWPKPFPHKYEFMFFFQQRLCTPASSRFSRHVQTTRQRADESLARPPFCFQSRKRKSFSKFQLTTQKHVAFLWATSKRRGGGKWCFKLLLFYLFLSLSLISTARQACQRTWAVFAPETLYRFAVKLNNGSLRTFYKFTWSEVVVSMLYEAHHIRKPSVKLDQSYKAAQICVGKNYVIKLCRNIL